MQPCPYNLGTVYFMIKGAIALKPHCMSLIAVQVKHKDDTELIKNEWKNILFPESIKHVSESKPISSALKCIMASPVSNHHCISVLSKAIEILEVWKMLYKTKFNLAILFQFVS